MNKTLLITVLLAVLIIGGAVSYVKSGGAPLKGQQDEVVDMASCAEGDRCIVVDNHCGFCCEYSAINAKYDALFNQSFDKRCKRYMGEYCSCFDLSSYPSCVAGECQLLKWPNETDNAVGKQPSPPAQSQKQSTTAPPPATSTPVSEPAPAPAQQPVYRPPAPQPAYVPPPQEQPPAPAGEPFGGAVDGFGDTTDSNADDSLFAPLPSELPDNYQMPGGNDPLYAPLPAGNP